MHRAAAQWMRVADKPGILGLDPVFLGFEYCLQVTLWSWYIYMQYLADNETSLSPLKRKDL